MATELLETLAEPRVPRRRAARVIASRTRVDPLPVLQGAAEYPEDAEERILELVPGSIVVDARGHRRGGGRRAGGEHRAAGDT